MKGDTLLHTHVPTFGELGGCQVSEGRGVGDRKEERTARQRYKQWIHMAGICVPPSSQSHTHPGFCPTFPPMRCHFWNMTGGREREREREGGISTISKTRNVVRIRVYTVYCTVTALPQQQHNLKHVHAFQFLLSYFPPPPFLPQIAISILLFHKKSPEKGRFGKSG